MKMILAVYVIFLMISCASIQNEVYDYNDHIDDHYATEHIETIMNEVAAMYYYDPKVKSGVHNRISSENEKPGVCQDYASTFIFIWNSNFSDSRAYLQLQSKRGEYELLDFIGDIRKNPSPYNSGTAWSRMDNGTYVYNVFVFDKDTAIDIKNVDHKRREHFINVENSRNHDWVYIEGSDWVAFVEPTWYDNSYEVKTPVPNVTNSYYYAQPITNFYRILKKNK